MRAGRPTALEYGSLPDSVCSPHLWVSAAGLVNVDVRAVASLALYAAGGGDARRGTRVCRLKIPIVVCGNHTALVVRSWLVWGRRYTRLETSRRGGTKQRQAEGRSRTRTEPLPEALLLQRLVRLVHLAGPVTVRSSTGIRSITSLLTGVEVPIEVASHPDSRWRSHRSRSAR